VSFYEVDYLTVEIDFDHPISIPPSTLDHPAVRLSPDLKRDAPHLDKVSARYDDLLVSAWHHWLRTARWATDQHSIGLHAWEVDGSPVLEMPRIHEKTTGYGIWSSPSVARARRQATIDSHRWAHIQSVLASELTAPVWFEYLVEAHQRLANKDYSGCVLSSTIACETIARAVFSDLAGKPKNAAVAELVDRTAAQAIIGRWKDLTGVKADGAVHRLFETRNSIVHSGRTDSIDKEIARKSLEAARKFVLRGDEWWFIHQGMPNPRMACPT
jgi:hypothetical protein